MTLINRLNRLAPQRRLGQIIGAVILAFGISASFSAQAKLIIEQIGERLTEDAEFFVDVNEDRVDDFLFEYFAETDFFPEEASVFGLEQPGFDDTSLPVDPDGQILSIFVDPPDIGETAFAVKLDEGIIGPELFLDDLVSNSPFLFVGSVGDSWPKGSAGFLGFRFPILLDAETFDYYYGWFRLEHGSLDVISVGYNPEPGGTATIPSRAPEPGSLLLLLGGAMGFAALRRKRQK
jgi:hypothetical protein